MELHLASRHGSHQSIILLVFSFTQYTLAQMHPPTDAASDDGSPMAFVGFIVLGVGAFVFFGCVIPLCIMRKGIPNTTTATTALNPNPEGVVRPICRGVDRNVVDTFPLINYAAVKHMRASKIPLECAICLSEFTDDDTLRLLPGCRHVFHVDCIDVWLAQRHTCPVCRSDLFDPKVISGKRILSLQKEPKDAAAAGCSHMSEQMDVQKLKEPRHVQSMTGWERFTLILPEDVMKDIRINQKYRKAISLQDYRNKGDTGKRDWRIQSFLNALSWKRQQLGDSKSTVAPEASGASDSPNISTRQLLAVPARSENEMLEIDSSWSQIELNNSHVDELV